MISFRTSRLAVVICTFSVLIGAYGYSATTIKIATTYPDGTAALIELKEAAKSIEELTDGEVKFKYYAGGVMGDDFTVKRKIRARQLHGGIVQTSVYASEVPNLNLYSLPMLFRNHSEANAVREKLDPLLVRELKESGIVPLGFIAVGFAYAMGTKPVGTIQEVRRSKVWAPKDDEGAKHNLKVFGINPIPLPVGDVLTGVQTGLIDTIASPPVVALALQWHTQVKYMLDIRLQYVYTIFALDERMFNRLTEEHQKVVRTVMTGALARVEAKLIEDHDEAFDVILEQGVELLTPNDVAFQEWRDLAEDAVSQWLEKGLVTREGYELLDESLRQFRSENAP